MSKVNENCTTSEQLHLGDREQYFFFSRSIWVKDGALFHLLNTQEASAMGSGN
jgi:formylmethanofuran dehydrogenase subunit E-like metal-binding protein